MFSDMTNIVICSTFVLLMDGLQWKQIIPLYAWDPARYP